MIYSPLFAMNSGHFSVISREISLVFMWKMFVHHNLVDMREASFIKAFCKDRNRILPRSIQMSPVQVTCQVICNPLLRVVLGPSNRENNIVKRKDKLLLLAYVYMTNRIGYTKRFRFFSALFLLSAAFACHRGCASPRQ